MADAAEASMNSESKSVTNSMMATGLDALREDYQTLKAEYYELGKQRQAVKKLEGACQKRVDTLLKRMDALQQEGSEQLRDMRGSVAEISSALPKPATLILHLILGDIPIILPTRTDKVTYKQNYEKFKMIHVVLMAVLAIISLIFSDQVLPSALVHCVSVWYYFTVTLRELILVSNGSKIKWWWLTHHYCSIIIAALLLTWPPGECYQAFKSQFMLFSFCLSLVMALQFRYQRAKLYREVAMGEKHHMTVSQETASGLKKRLVMCLLGIYVFQLYNAYALLHLYFSTDLDCSDWQVPILGILFLIIALMNSSTLTSVMKSKKTKKKSR